jgi:hypothetical protein
MLPALQAERQYFDPCACFYGTSSDKRKYFRRGFMHVERWEKEGEQDGLRVFLPLKPRWSVPERYVEECVLYSVRLIEDPKVDDGLGEFDWDDR